MAANPPVMTYLRSHRAVAFAVVAAAVVVGLCAVVAIAWMLGWIPPQASALPASNPAQQAKAAGANDALDANESVVSPAEAPARPEPLMPTYSQPHAPTPAPLPTADAAAAAVAPPRPAKAAAPSAPARAPREAYAQTDPTRPGPVAPSFTPRPASACDSCGVVTSITTYPRRWEVRVRLDEGGAQTFPFRSVPPYRIGDRVRIEGSRLLYD